MLYLVPTPIGNLGDITMRALEVLGSVDYILAEDTRTSGKLLSHYHIDTQTKPFHSFNEHKVLPSIIADLQSGMSIACITDAGTPGISDPGFLLVRECHNYDIEVTTLPGATAFVPALVSSGIPSDKFFFEGFLPHKKGRQTRWQFLVSLQTTVILYESTHRIIKCLEEVETYYSPETVVCVSREISKKFEEHKVGPVNEIRSYYANEGSTKGEFVVVISGGQ